MCDPYTLMACNNAWANATLYAAISGLSAAEFAAPRPGFFPTLKATLNHIHAVDLYYLDALEQGGLGRTVYEREPFAEVERLAQAQAATDARLIAFCRALEPDALAAPRVTERPDGPIAETVGALLLHLFQHQIHHRGQAHTMIGEAGLAPPQLDDFYLRYGRAPSADAYRVP